MTQTIKFVLLIVSASAGISSAYVQSKCPSWCVLLTQCPAPLVLLGDKNIQANREAVQQLRDAYCRRLLICCEMLAMPRPEEDVSKHRNVALLPQSCGYSEVSYIITGKEAAVGELPWMALISYETKNGNGKEFRCAGSLINSRYVLTAAHCVKGLQVAGVRLGVHDKRIKVACWGTYCESLIQDKLVEKVIVHSEYYHLPGRSIRNDIALLRFERPATTVLRNVRPICLPLAKEQITQDLTEANATIAGWGKTETGSDSSVLLKAYVPIHSQESCRSFYNRPGNTEDVALKKFCAGTDKVDSCRGDSGGPLILPELDAHGNPKYTQYGIVSYGPAICSGRIPGVYTDVRPYVAWILDNIEP